MRAALAAQGQPQRCCPHTLVAGTNGKGYCSAVLAAIATQAKRRCGLFTSPHLVRFNERIRVDGCPIADDELIPLAAEALQLFGGDETWLAPVALRGRFRACEPPLTLTYFELATLIATRHFADRACRFAVYEIGMGGRLDATNALDPAVCIITALGLDHQAYLGDTLAAIAAEKAGILRTAVPFVLASRSAVAELSAAAATQGAPCSQLGRDFGWQRVREGVVFEGLGARYRLPALSGAADFQLDNASGAIAAALLLARQGHLPPLDEALVDAALAACVWPGRLWRLPSQALQRWLAGSSIDASERPVPPVLLDAAHNGHGARALADALRARTDARPLHLLVNCAADKDIEAIGEALRTLPRLASVTVPPFRSPRASLPADFRARAGFAQAELAPSLADGLRHALECAGPEGLLVVCGSIYLLGELLTLLGCEEEAMLSFRPVTQQGQTA